LRSGSARFSAPGSNGAGTIVGNSLEGSSVDIATEFTKLIQAQRVYSANARTITTADNMLQEIINVIR
jgi:flagellar hook protein FlgE